jgi:predicted RND superfamily exporter protein
LWHAANLHRSCESRRLTPPAAAKLLIVVSMAKKPVWAHWLILALTTLLFVLVAKWVDLKPVVDENFFFSSGDAALRQSKKIEKWFPSQPEVILNIASGDISSARYLSRIAKLTREIQAIDSVSTVKSLTAGPKSFQDALASPFWRRLLIARDRKSSKTSRMSWMKKISAFTSPVRLTSSR